MHKYFIRVLTMHFAHAEHILLEGDQAYSRKLSRGWFWVRLA